MVSTPLTVDGRVVASEDDARALAAAALAGHLGAMPGDSGPFDGVTRAWQAIDGSPWADAFAEAMAAGLNVSETAEAAVHFFTIAPGAPYGDRLLARLGAARSGAEPLDAERLSGALHALGRRAMGGDTAALAFAQRDASSGQDPEPYIAALTRADPDWVTAHAEAIVKVHPQVALPILFNLQSIGVDPTPLGVAIAPHAKRAPSFGKMLARFIDNPGPIKRAMR